MESRARNVAAQSAQPHEGLGRYVFSCRGLSVVNAVAHVDGLMLTPSAVANSSTERFIDKVGKY